MDELLSKKEETDCQEKWKFKSKFGMPYKLKPSLKPSPYILETDSHSIDIKYRMEMFT